MDYYGDVAYAIMCINMQKIRHCLLCGAFALSMTVEGGVNLLALDASADRVESPLSVGLKQIGTIRPRAARECERQRGVYDFARFLKV